MRQIGRLFEIWGKVAAAAGVLVLVALALCSCAEPEAIVPVPPTPTPYSPPPIEAPLPTPKPTVEALQFPLEPPAHVGIDRVDDQNCVDCHTDADALKSSMEVEEQPQGPISEGEDWGGELPPMEPWQKVFLADEAFFETMHGRYGCITCHGGTADTSFKEAAHQGLVPAPSGVGVCGDCHYEAVATGQNSLHTNLNGYRTILAARSTADRMPQLEVMMENHCQPCHTSTCGQCHVSQPANMGGGLVASHIFERTPVMNLTCIGCHGSRIDGEYKGQDGDTPGDVHWVEGKMPCSDCHLTAEMHGTVGDFIHRYDGAPMPSCQEKRCHSDVAVDDGIEQHGDSHLELLSCQVCHSTAYKNCYGCHVGMEDEQAYFKVEPAQIMFKIGRNSLQGSDRPWAYVPVRHVPITRDSFDYYGSNLMPNFNALPTWKYATPHTIQRITPQTETCDACHGNADLFLTASDVAPDELEANKDVIVEELPFSMP